MRIQINALAVVAAFFACSLVAHCSVLVPTYVLPPPSFNTGQRTLARLAGGHLRLPSLRDAQSQQHNSKANPDHGKNSLTPPGEKDIKYGSQRFKENEVKDPDIKNYDKYSGVVVKTEGQNVGWNQGQWDDGMLMSSAGDGEEKGKKKAADTDEDKKTLSDQVAEGKYGLIQKEIFVNPPTQPGVISYTANPETKNKDNESSLGGLKKEEIWLAEDHLLVLKGGSFPDHGAKPTAAGEAWPAIDAYVAPPRQVKIPQNPEVPPPFPVRLSDGGPLVFLTPEGSIPAPAFPPLPGFGASAPPPFSGPYPPAFPPQALGPDQGNFTAGRAPFPFAPFPFAPRNGSDFPFPFPFPATMNNGSFPGGPQGPGAQFAPPPGNLTDLYDEDDPSIYYPPPYSFYYRADNTSKVPAGPLVPGIVLPPPPDFFAPLEPYTTKAPSTSTTSTTTQAPAHAYPATPAAPPTSVLKPRPPHRRPASPTSGYLPVGKPSYALHDNTIDNISTQTPKAVTITSRPAHRQPDRVVVIPKPTPPRKIYSNTPVVVEKNPPSVTVLHKPIKTTLKPVPISGLYDFPEKNYFEGNSVTQSPRPFPVYGPPERARIKQFPDKTYVTSTPVPLRAYYSEPTYAEAPQPQIQYTSQTDGRLRPDYFNARQNGKSVASFYFYEEPSKAVVATPSPVAYFDGRNYYQSVGANGQDGYFYNSQSQGGFEPSSNLEYAPVPSRDPSPFFFSIPQRQGSRTLTQEYFSVQKPKAQTFARPNNVQQQAPVSSQQQSIRPSTFYDQIANIQQTIDYYTTRRPIANAYRPSPYREVRQKPKPTPRPVYQFSYQSESARPEQNTFRAPQMDSEPFRPMVSYSKPFNVEGEKYRATPTPIIKTTTESSYATLKPEEFKDYQDIPLKSENPAIKNRQRGLNPTTRNPVNHAYYTKQEEGLFDDITKNYFTIFGQKIEHSNSDGVGVAVTAPIKPVEVSTVKTPLDNGINIRYEENSAAYAPERQAVVSLSGDTAVNYRQPRPLINPESEFIPIVNPEVQAKYEADRQLKQIRDQLSHRQRVKNVEIIKSEGIEQADQFEEERLQQYYNSQAGQTAQRGQSQSANEGYNKAVANSGGRAQVAEGRPGSLVAYRLPGEGAHVYFLTPQPARPDGLKYRTPEEIAALS